ncbi:MAG TPA: LacI family DNA-binding transcriptional regulator [Casimicrobiaceae bacterium]|nr:LacI family DNA-binding transcriptional regulator [Casimicrobiaceae bacterium]
MEQKAPRKPAAALRDVARAAGVSTASASRALSRPEAVSAHLRERVLAAARRLDYVPNLAARTLARRRSGVVGLLVDDLSEPLAAAVAGSLDRALEKAGLTLAIATGVAKGAETAGRVRTLLGRGVDALVSWETALASSAEEQRESASIPWLVFGESDESPATLSAGVGRRSGAVLGCRYLASLGHTRLAILARQNAPAARAAREALGTATLLVAEADCGRSEAEGMRAAIQTLFDRHDAPTAVLCASDLQAASALRECHRRGIAVPRELSIVGFGDSDLARETWPALTTLRIPVEEIGAWAAQAILLMLQGDTPEPLDPAPKLVVRESTAEAPR